MLNFITKVIGDFFLGKESREVKGSKRVFRKENTNYLDMIDIENVPLIQRSMSQYGVFGEHDPNLKTLLIVDDCNVNSLYGADFQIIKAMYNIDIYKEFNVYQATGENCGIESIKLMNNIEVDYAILDLTLGNFCEIKNHPNKFVEIDGVDLGIYLTKKKPNAKIVFSTAHIFNTRYPEFQEYMYKFETETKMKFKDHYINKLSDTRTEEFFTFFGYTVEE